MRERKEEAREPDSPAIRHGKARIGDAVSTTAHHHSHVVCLSPRIGEARAYSFSDFLLKKTWGWMTRRFDVQTTWWLEGPRMHTG
eukprot:557331-Pelagomonas_calceolata.AAC.1